MSDTLELRTVKVVNYITPLREGGSLPAIAEADDGFLYVIKFRGAGQGSNALIADLIGAELARSIGLRVPELVFAELDEAFGRTEPDEEIQDLLRASTGLNLGIHFLSGAITYDPIVNKMDNETASKILWLDIIITNVDRTVRNTNMLVWQKELWLIDHGAALYFHHTWDNWKEQSLKPVLNIKDHVLLPIATMLEKVDKEIKQLLPLEKIREIVSLIPDSWLVGKNTSWTLEQKRDVYYQFLVNRINHSSEIIKQVMHER
jgi:hypothetical protein